MNEMNLKNLPWNPLRTNVVMIIAKAVTGSSKTMYDKIKAIYFQKMSKYLSPCTVKLPRKTRFQLEFVYI